MARIVSVAPKDPEPAAIAEAAAVLAAGGVLGMPTETVYGLAARCDLPGALARLRALKGRPADEAFPVQVADAGAAVELVGTVPLRARPLMKHFWPGPLTIVFPSGRLNVGGQGLGIRVPAHAVSQAVLRRAGAPLAVPSANPRGAPPATLAVEVADYFPREVDLVLDAGPAAIREASTVVRVNERGFEILREGLISRSMLEKLIAPRTYLFVCTGNTCRSPLARAMGERLFAEHLGLDAAELELLGFRFLSAGTAARPGGRASALAQKTAAEVGLSLEGHRTKRLSERLLGEADAVICLEERHLDAVADLLPEALAKTRLMGPDEIPDPAGGDAPEYRRAREAIARALKELLRQPVPARAVR